MVTFNIYLIFILIVLTGSFILDLIVERLNIKRLTTNLPAEFEGFYDSEKYAKSQLYTREGTRFGIIKSTFGLILTLGFILLGGFNWIDQVSRGLGLSTIPTGLIFTAILVFGSQIIFMPFSIYDTFVIEEKYGFNKTTVKTFILDFLKGLLLTVIIGAPLYAMILWFFDKTGVFAWLYVWGAVTLFQLIMMYIGPVLIMPLFNKFTPLEEGELRTSIENYAREHNFKMKGVFTMDGSKRSSKSNAFFTGFGKTRRIALFDTLMGKHTVPEILGILAHEIGHYKLKHIPKNILLSVLTSGLMFYILSIFLNNQGLFDAFGMEHVSIYASLVFFSFLYAPISMILGIISNVISRSHEYQADAFAARTTGNPDSMVVALKKLSVDNLSNLTPHPLKVFLEYSHPPVLERINAIRKLSLQSTDQ